MSKRTEQITISLILLFALTSSNALEAEKAIVTMFDTAVAISQEILLGDIADVESQDKMLADEIRNAHIYSPAPPGFSVTLNVGYVKARLGQQGISAETIDWRGSKNVVVETKCIRLSPSEILSSAKEFIKEMLGETEGDLNVKPLNEIRPIVLPYGNIEAKVEAISQALSGSIVPLRLLISVSGIERERRIIPFKVELIREVVVATRTIGLHEIIASDDLAIAKRDVGINTNIFSQPESLLSKRAKRMIPKNGVINGDMLENPPIVKQGDIVIIAIESPTFRITTQGKAREDGIHNQFIRVMNTSSMKEITAQVVNEKLVKVAFK